MAVRQRMITAFGKTQTITEWSRETGIPANTIGYRLDSGMPPEIAMSPRDADRWAWRNPDAAELKKRARRIFKQTRSIAETARILDRSPSVIHKHLAEQGIFLEDIIRETKRRSWRLYKIGKTTTEIARIVDRSPSMVRKYINEAANNPALQMWDRSGYCACGQPATHREKITVGASATEYLELCDKHHAEFLEIESTECTDIPTTKARPRF